MSIEPISAIRPVVGTAGAGAATAWSSGDGAGLAREALAHALAQDSAGPQGLAEVLAPDASDPHALAAAQAPDAGEPSGVPALHAADAAVTSPHTATPPPAASALSAQALWPGSDWAQATAPVAPPQAMPAPEATARNPLPAEAVAAASLSADALRLPMQARERVASPATQRSEPAFTATTESAPMQPVPLGAPARAPEVAATPAALSALHPEQATAAHVQARQSKPPLVERDPRRRRRAELPALDPEEDLPPPSEAPPWKPRAHEAPVPESAPSGGWRYSELSALLRLAGQRDALRELDQHRRVLVCLPPRQGGRLEGDAHRWRLCVLWIDGKGQGRVIESASLWWPGTAAAGERWQAWPAHREQSTHGHDRLVVRASAADASPALQVRFGVHAARQHPAPPQGLECIDLLDPRGTLRAFAGQWSVTLLRAPRHLDPQHMRSCLAGSADAQAPELRVPDAERPA